MAEPSHTTVVPNHPGDEQSHTNVVLNDAGEKPSPTADISYIGLGLNRVMQLLYRMMQGRNKVVHLIYLILQVLNQMISLTKPTSGAAYVQGLDIRNHMNGIYTSMGVCPQHDLLWESLTGREHLLFYGRLKSLTGSLLTHAVEESLKSLNLYHGRIADKQDEKYSGGMKRRLSVAISRLLIKSLFLLCYFPLS
ncbi:ABC transporter A family member 7-like isoform X2 [Vicia villosa]|uniref:ABC transporter A family member 7-like isoform X2 n=1 Tax=Vicia villosa TaxID=3911 RepID=UPI00273B3D58|nr:ABC transporter A family member 7-like isoform X2 [Vicia villosa]XP_058770946.1 ABC transporter A family member 7-like isoform X2 [Vicia villosa]